MDTTASKPIYEIGSPLFDKVTIKLNPDYYKGSEFVIETRNNSNENRYLQSVNLNGTAMDQVWFYHDEIVKGGRLILEMGNSPNKNLGSDPQTRPGFNMGIVR